MSYWRCRVTRILKTRHLLPAQLAIASALMAEIDAASDKNNAALFGSD
ncbi:hypothetical protein [Caballeronia sp. ATUFL_M1_KS5A]|nr:hypothetical protein [Caballeronia sp. ATUFL_M1_KS5A]